MHTRHSTRQRAPTLPPLLEASVCPVSVSGGRAPAGAPRVVPLRGACRRAPPHCRPARPPACIPPCSCHKLPPALCQAPPCAGCTSTFQPPAPRAGTLPTAQCLGCTPAVSAPLCIHENQAPAPLEACAGRAHEPGRPCTVLTWSDRHASFAPGPTLRGLRRTAWRPWRGASLMSRAPPALLRPPVCRSHRVPAVRPRKLSRKPALSNGSVYRLCQLCLFVRVRPSPTPGRCCGGPPTCRCVWIFGF